MSSLKIRFFRIPLSKKYRWHYSIIGSFLAQSVTLPNRQ